MKRIVRIVSIAYFFLFILPGHLARSRHLKNEKIYRAFLVQKQEYKTKIKHPPLNANVGDDGCVCVCLCVSRVMLI